MPTPTPDDFLLGSKRRKEFSRDIGQDWNIREIAGDLYATHKPTATNYPLAGNDGILTPWIEVTVFSNSWVNYGGFSTAGYRKIGDIVYLKGLLKNGTLSTEVFNLPAGYRPALPRHFITMMSGMAGGLRIHPVGEVKFGVPDGGGNGYCSLDGIHFETSG